MLVCRMALHADKVHMWCAMSISGIFFFFCREFTLVCNTLTPFLEQLSHYWRISAISWTWQCRISLHKQFCVLCAEYFWWRSN